MTIVNKVQGYVSWRVEKESTGEVIQSSGGQYPNLVVDTGLDNLNDTPMETLTNHCRVGTDGTAPSVSNTDLGARVGNASSAGGNAVQGSAGDPQYYYAIRDYTFQTTANISGVALAEMGFFESTNVNADMFSRVLFKDGTGTPVTITLLPDEILIVTYEIRKYIPDISAPVTGTFDVDHGAGPVTYNYTLTPMNINSSNAWGTDQMVIPNTVKAFENDVLVSPTDTSVPLGGLGQSTIAALPSSYVSGSFSRSLSVSGGITTANFPTGIGGMAFLDIGSNMYHVTFSPKIPKSATETLDFQNFLTISWDRGVLP